jgi:hypothetical protein
VSGARRARQLAERFEATNEEVVAVLERLSDEHWDRLCPGEGWPVRVTAHHIAVAYPVHIRTLQAIADGRPLRPVTWSDLEHLNARHAEDHAACTKRETVDALRGNGAAVADAIGGLTDVQLEQSGSFIAELPAMTVEAWIELVLIGHPRMHLHSIRAGAGI